ncbi:MAG TPA: flagellar hook-associated protein FlgK [Thermotogota bacterium]|nr:flagellar hook-associated protein FlgK [Thermotogota bacterium]
MADISIFSILNTGVLGTYTAKLAMSVTAHNIANTNTEGYSRQRADIYTTPPLATNSLTQPGIPMTIGTGSMVKRIERIRDQFLDTQYRTINENHSYWDNTYSNLHYLEQLLDEPSEDGFRQYFDNMWFSFQEVMNDPANDATIQSVKGEVNNFIEVYKDLYGRFNELRDNLNQDIKDTVSQINSITGQIGDLNSQIRMAYLGNSSPNDLLDERDRLLDELTQYADTTIKSGENGHLEIYIGQQVVVHGDDVTEIKTSVRPETLNTYDLFVRGTLIDVQSGELGSLINLRDETIPNYLDKFDEMSLMLSDKLNLIHQAGYDKSGKITGIDLFKEMEQIRSSYPNLYRMAGTNSILSGPIRMASTEISSNPSGTSLGLSGNISFVDLNNFLFNTAVSTGDFKTSTKFEDVMNAINSLGLYTTNAKNFTLDAVTNEISLTNFDTYTGKANVFYKTTESIEYSNDGIVDLPDLIDIDGDGQFTDEDIRIIDSNTGTVYEDYTYDIATGKLVINNLPSDYSGDVDIQLWKKAEMSVSDGTIDYSGIETELTGESADNFKIFLKTVRSDVMRTTDLDKNPTGLYNMLLGIVNDGIDEYGNVDEELVNSLGDLKDLLVLDNDGILARMGYNTIAKEFLKISDFTTTLDTYLRDGLEGIWWLDNMVNQDEFSLDPTSKTLSILTDEYKDYESSFTFADSSKYTFSNYDNVNDTIDLLLSGDIADYEGKARILYSTEETNQGVTNAGGGVGTVTISGYGLHDGNGDGVIDASDVKIYGNSSGLLNDITVNTDGTITINSGWNGTEDVSVVHWDEVRRDIDSTVGVESEIKLDKDIVNFDDRTNAVDLSADIKLKYASKEPEESFNDPVHLFYVAEEQGKSVTLDSGSFKLNNLIDIDDDQEITTADISIRIDTDNDGVTDTILKDGDFSYDKDLEMITIDTTKYSGLTNPVKMDIRRWVKSYEDFEDGSFDFTKLNQSPVALNFSDTEPGKSDFRIFKSPLLNNPEEINDTTKLKTITFTIPVEQTDGSTDNTNFQVDFYTQDELVDKINNNLVLKDYLKAFEYEGDFYISAKGSLNDISEVVVKDEFNVLDTVDMNVLNLDTYDTLNNIMYSYNNAYAGDYSFSNFTNASPDTIDLNLNSNLTEYNGKAKIKYATYEQNLSISPTGGKFKVDLGTFEIKDTNEDGKINRLDIKLFQTGTNIEITNFAYDEENDEIILETDPGNVDIVYWTEDTVNLNGNAGDTYTLQLSKDVIHFDSPDLTNPSNGISASDDFKLKVELPPDEMSVTLGTADIKISLNSTTMESLVEQINKKVPTGITADLTPDNRLVFRAGSSIDFHFGQVLNDGRIVQIYDIDAPTIFWEKMGFLSNDSTFGSSWNYNTDIVNNYLDESALLHNEVSSDNLDVDTRQANGLYDFTNRLSLSSQIESNPMLLAIDYGRWQDLDGDWISDLHTPIGGASSSSDSIITKLSEARDALMINNGSTSFSDFFGVFVSEMGIESQTAMRMTSNNQVMLTQIDNERERVKGVSLDEEMSNMIKYQQAFNAAARVVTAVDEMISRIIDNLGLAGR